MILYKKVTPQQMMEAFATVNSATPDDLCRYAQPDVFSKTFLPTTEADNHAEPQKNIEQPKSMVPRDSTSQLYLYHIGIEHMGRRSQKHWQTTPGVIYQRWITAIYPLLHSLSHRLIVSNSPFDRIQEDWEILDHALDPNPETLQFYTYNCSRPPRLNRFEIWIKTTCDHMPELRLPSKFGQKANTYISKLSDVLIWVDYIGHFWADISMCDARGKYCNGS